MKNKARFRARGHSSDGRALQWHCRGPGFDSPWLHQIGRARLRRAGLFCLIYCICITSPSTTLRSAQEEAIFTVAPTVGRCRAPLILTLSEVEGLVVRVQRFT